MNSARAIQNPIVQSIYRRLSTSDSRAIVFSIYNNSNCYSNIYDKSLKLVSNCQRVLTSTDRTKFHIQNGMASSAKDGPSTSSQKDSKHKPNRLSLEKSPYLLQHMYNPVDWFPWGDEALEKAQRENKVIFLSVGYSTCHWCHVMEKETFENEAVAKIMNEYFVNIKVDREERPDIDKVYMLFIQTMTYHGGWPMSVFLTPDLKPITGGTYFPPDDRGHLIGFKTILFKVMDNWKCQKDFVLSTGQKFVSALQKVSDSDLQTGQRINVPPLKVIQKCFEQFARSYEPEHGGFSDRPKFPQPSNFNFLFHVYARNSNSEIGRLSLDMCLNTLQKMSNGGIYDHIGDGFSRYSTDSEWHVPHFEKMLYDQGQLVISYCDAYVVKKEKIYSDVLQGILKYVSRDLSHQLGGFYSAEDADSLPQFNSEHKKEGAFYVWELSEIEKHLGKFNHKDVKYSDVFSYHYDVKPDGNVPPHQDPHEELTNQNVLIIRESSEKTAEEFNFTVEEVKTILNKSKQILFDARNLRPRPHLDNKIITAWNGLMISGYAKAGYVLKDQSYINRAILAANFIKKYLYNEQEKTLLRSCYVGTEGQIVQTSVPIQGFLDDYAFLIQGLIDLYEASLDTDWLAWGEILQETQDRLFWDSDNSGYFQSSSDPTVILRLKEDQDGAEPSGNSVSVKNLLRGAAYLNRNDLKSKAGRVLTAFSSRLERIPMALPEMTSALMSYHDSPPQILIAGSLDDERTQVLLDVVRARLLPGRLLAVTGSDGRSEEGGLLHNRLEVLRRMSHVDGKPAAYVCRHYSCTLPVTDPVQLANLLDEHYDLEKYDAGDGAPSTTQ